jgi:hypothetical protein
MDELKFMADNQKLSQKDKSHCALRIFDLNSELLNTNRPAGVEGVILNK